MIEKDAGKLKTARYNVYCHERIPPNGRELVLGQSVAANIGITSMCLAIPGQIISLSDDSDPLARTGRVSFSGINKDISLAYVPDAKLNDYVIVHAGFALSILDEANALATLQAFNDLAELRNEL